MTLYDNDWIKLNLRKLAIAKCYDITAGDLNICYEVIGKSHQNSELKEGRKLVDFFDRTNRIQYDKIVSEFPFMKDICRDRPSEHNYLGNQLLILSLIPRASETEVLSSIKNAIKTLGLNTYSWINKKEYSRENVLSIFLILKHLKHNNNFKTTPLKECLAFQEMSNIIDKIDFTKFNVEDLREIRCMPMDKLIKIVERD